jgi:hypothetical protein
MASLNDFKAYMKNGMARTSHFLVQLTIPKGLQGRRVIYTSNMNMITAFCEQVMMPGVTYSSNQVRSYGEFREVPYEKLYGQVSMTFYVDGSMYVKTFFDDWIDVIQNKETRDFRYAEDYLVDKIPIIVYDMQEDARYQIVLNRCYPKGLGAIQLDYNGKDVMRLTVDMTYQFYTIDTMGINKLGGIEPETSQNVIDAFGSQPNNVTTTRYLYNDRPSLNDQLPDQLNAIAGRGDTSITTTP